MRTGMTERTILVLIAFAAMTAILIAVDVLLSIFFDEGMRRKKSSRVITPNVASRNGGTCGTSSRVSHPKRTEPWGKR